ncbi:TetR family transcriptional regulator [Micromonospora pisi]|uniref:TetR family transcriptional regulator n=1 Tax=Micromonospora pisi TaxID=589240 RepID=A0A495JU86_9ACTN|nr:TetR/AcrR family transcriptional regulator [Micromonospora pisi]RKR92577.1 TetR family transcriptional regulator [Micromonospora pisi]
MTNAAPASGTLSHRPKRADARRNYEKLVAAARTAFGEEGVSASLEDIARRAEVGIGTLYRHFPTRRELFEAVYIDEVEAVSRSAADLSGEPPWEALVGWLRRLVDYIGTKRALAEELIHDSEIFRRCRDEVYAAGQPLLERAQTAGVVRSDTNIDDVMRLVSGITLVKVTEPAQLERVLNLALDGLRPQAPRS